MAEALARPPRRVPPHVVVPTPGFDTDVLIVGGGPGGSTTATFLARAGLDVTVVEREPFPRFKVGESLVPNCMPILERLGALGAVKAHGFLDKFGVTFHDQELEREATFTFREGRPWPTFTYDVHRAEFDQVLLDHAARTGARLLQPVTVEKVAFDADGVTVRVSDADGERTLRARFLVDASGRDGFLASRQGRREPMPGLGKVRSSRTSRAPSAGPGVKRAMSASTSSPRAGSGTSRSRGTRPAWAACCTRARSRPARVLPSSSSTRWWSAASACTRTSRARGR